MKDIEAFCVILGMNFCCAALAPAVSIADFTRGETRLTAALSRRELARDRLRGCLRFRFKPGGVMANLRATGPL